MGYTQTSIDTITPTSQHTCSECSASTFTISPGKSYALCPGLKKPNEPGCSSCPVRGLSQIISSSEGVFGVQPGTTSFAHSQELGVGFWVSASFFLLSLCLLPHLSPFSFCHTHFIT
ncbi:hypothetical protein ATANTOWER_008586 [Ataeniobius toweri]|uniref:Tyrosine-protein kinase ephrin type A/B receptor-like domain-containing protein n=1 Tax=Ataeniobius toweri TaxID=208326 RepID=A0ABU7B8D3_9TELE|nr:hypothetical protein [Ataeniobius toweri]